MQLASQVVGNLASDLARLFWPPMVRAFKNEIAYPPSILFKSTGPKTFQIQIVSKFHSDRRDELLMHTALSKSNQGPSKACRLRNRNTLDSGFNPVEFDGIRKQACRLPKAFRKALLVYPAKQPLEHNDGNIFDQGGRVS